VTKHDYRECDICEDKIEQMNHLRLRRFWLHGWVVRLCNWGLVDRYESGWRKSRVDLCRECWDETKATVRERVS